MSKASDAGKSFLAGVLAKLPESARAQAEAAFGAAEAEAALEVIGAGTLAQPDINRHYDEIRGLREALDSRQTELEAVHVAQEDWWTKHKTTPVTTPVATPVVDTTAIDAVRKDMADQISSLQRDGVSVMAFLSTLGMKHFREFGEEPDLTALTQDRQLGTKLADGRTYGLLDAYHTKYGEKVQARATEAENRRIQTLVEEGVKERMKGIVNQPFPIRNGAPAAIDILESTVDTPDKHTIESAAALYDQLQAARG